MKHECGKDFYGRARARARKSTQTEISHSVRSARAQCHLSIICPGSRQLLIRMACLPLHKEHKHPYAKPCGSLESREGGQRERNYRERQAERERVHLFVVIVVVDFALFFLHYRLNNSIRFYLSEINNTTRLMPMAVER